MVQGACQSTLAGAATTSSAAAAARPQLAPLWHTRALVLLLLSVAATGSMLGQRLDSLTSSAARPAERYVPLLIVNLALALYVARFGLARSSFSDLLWLTRKRPSASSLLADAAWAAALAVSLFAAENLLQTWLGFPESVAAHGLVAESTSEQCGWLGLAVSIGFSEELVYRGYLQRQLALPSGQAWLGVALQALLFGIAHAEQGGQAVARFAAYGLGFGWVAARRRTLLPGIMAHVALDLCAGLGR